MKDLLRRKIESLFSDYCFNLGPDELMINPRLIVLAQQIEEVLFAKLKWRPKEVERKFLTFIKNIRPEMRQKTKLEEIESEIIQNLNLIENISSPTCRLTGGSHYEF